MIMKRYFKSLFFFLLFVACLTSLAYGVNTLTRRLIGMEDLNLAVGGTGAAETFNYTTQDGLTLTLTKPDATHLNLRSSTYPGSVESFIVSLNNFTGALINGAYSQALKLKEIINKGPEVDARAYGTAGQAAIIAALADIGSKQKTLVLYPGLLDTTTAWSITADQAIPANVALKISHGAILSIATTKTLTINGGLEAGLYQIFSCSGTGKVTFGYDAAKEVYPEWWYSGSGDFSPAIQAAIDSGTGGVTVSVPTCICQTQINVDWNYTRLIGRGKGLTTVYFQPSGTATLFYLRNATASKSLMHITMRDMQLTANNTQTKTYINAIDVQNSEFSNLIIYDVGSTGSIGLQINGRDETSLSRISITAKQPIVVGANPNNPAAGYEAMDAWRWTNIQTMCDSPTGTNVLFQDGDYTIANLQVDGLNMNLGQYGIYWKQTGASYISQQNCFKNVRYEQTQSASGSYGIYVKHNQGQYNLTIQNVQIDAHTGLYLRNVVDAVLINYAYAPGSASPGNAYDFDTTCRAITAVNSTLSSAGTLSLGGMRKSFATEVSYGDTIPHRCFEQFVSSTDTGYQSILFNGVRRWSWHGTLGAGASISLPIIAATAGEGSIRVAAYVAGDTNEFLDCFITQGAIPVRLSNSTTNTADSDQAGKICLISGAAMSLKNNRAYTATITLVADWNDSGD
jgi:hypothetical protein